MSAQKKNDGVNLSGSKPAPSRGPKATLTTAQIARAAIEIADLDGLAAVTMQRVAREVGVTTMALYRYFPGKAELMALMIDSAGEPAARFGKASSPWGARLKLWAHGCLEIYREHPWFLEATTVRRTPMGPNELAWMEAALVMLAESGLETKERHHAFLTIIGHVRGHATFEQIRRRNAPGRRWIRDLMRDLKQEGERFPELLKVLGSGAFGDEPGAAFDFGLDCILEGIRAHVAGHGTRRARIHV
jgi:AcrR family transcriptional regulator